MTDDEADDRYRSENIAENDSSRFGGVKLSAVITLQTARSLCTTVWPASAWLTSWLLDINCYNISSSVDNLTSPKSNLRRAHRKGPIGSDDSQVQDRPSPVKPLYILTSNFTLRYVSGLFIDAIVTVYL